MKSKLLAILCVLSLMGWSHAEEAASGNVAAITVGETTKEYATLDEAITAANKAETSQAVTVKLLQNVTRTTDVGLGAAYPITLNLAGFTLDLGSAQLYTKSTGLVTLTGNGTVKNNAATNADYAAIWVISSSALKLDGVTVEGNYCAVKNSGTLEVAAATIKATKFGIGNFGIGRATIGVQGGNQNAVSVTSGWPAITSAADTGFAESAVVIYGGTFTTTGTNWDEGPIYWAGHGALTIYGGTFTNTASNTGAAGLLQKNGTVAVYGGTFSAKDGIKLVAQDNSTELTTTIQGGTFTGTRSGLYIDASNSTYMGQLTAYEVTVANGETSTPTFKGGDKGALYTKTDGLGDRTLMTMIGGLYTTNPSIYCSAGYTATETTVEGETLWAVQPAVAQIGETSYATLAAAVEAVPADGTQTTIVLLQSCTGSGIKVAANKNIVFDLNGNTYTVTNPAVGSSGTETNAFQLLKGATVTFRNGALESVATGAKILIQNYCNLTLDGVTLNAQRSDKIAYTLSNNCGQVTVTGATKLYTSAGKVAFDLYYWPKGGYSEGVSVTFDAAFTGLVEGKIEYDHDNTVNDADCAEKAILTVAEGAQGLFDVTFSTSVVGANIQLKGGRYTADPSTYCSAGYTATETTVESETLWAVQPAVAQIGETIYPSLAAAVDAVPADGTQTTIVLLQSCTGSGVKVAADKNIVFNLNGKTYTVTNPVGSSGTETNGFQLLRGATVTFQNGTIESASAKILIQNYCNLTLDGVTLNAKKNAQIEYALSNNCGQVTVTGETKIYASAEKVAFDLYYWPKGGYGEGVSVTFDVDFTGQVVGKVEYAADGTATEGWQDTVLLTVEAGCTGTFALDLSTSVQEPNIQLKGGFYTSDPSAYCAKGYMASETTVDGKALWTVQPAVAQIGETIYPSLAAAVEAVPTDGTQTTIVLLQSCTGSGVKVVANKNIIFDLNGKTYTVTNPTVGSSGTETNGFQLLKGATVTFQNGTIESASAKILIQNYCNLTLDGVTLNAQKNEQIQYTLSNNCGQVTVTGATKIYASAGQVAFDLYYWPKGGYGEGVSVTFGENFTGLVEGKVKYAADDTATEGWQDTVPLTVEAGCTGTFALDLSAIPTGANVAFKGGFFTAYVGAYCAKGYAAYVATTSETALWQVLPEGSSVAAVSSSEATYATLEAALYAAQSGDTVTLLQALALESRLSLPKALTLNLGGYVLTGAITVSAPGVTLTNGTLSAGTETMPLYLAPASAAADGTYSFTLAADATISGGVWSIYHAAGTALDIAGKVQTSEADSAAISGNGTQHGTRIVIRSTAELSAGDTAIYHPQSGELRIEGGTITGSKTGIEIRAGKLLMTGGTVVGNGVPTESKGNGSGTTTVGAGIAVAQHTTKLPLEVSISGGEVSGYTALSEANPQGNEAEVLKDIKLDIQGGTFKAQSAAVVSADCKGFISGGYFSNAVPLAYCATGKVPKMLKAGAEGYTEAAPYTVATPTDENFVAVKADGSAEVYETLADVPDETKVYIAPSAETVAAVAAALGSAKATTGPAEAPTDATEVTGLKVKEVAEVLGGAFTVKQVTNQETQTTETKLVYHYNFGVAGLEVKRATPDELALTVVAKLTEGELPANRTLVGRTLQVVLEKGDRTPAETYSVANPVFDAEGQCRVAVPWEAMTHGTNTIKVKVVK